MLSAQAGPAAFCYVRTQQHPGAKALKGRMTDRAIRSCLIDDC